MILLICRIRNLYAGQEARVRTNHGTMNWFKTGKVVHQDCILSPCLFNLYAENIMKVWGWVKHKLQSTLPGGLATIPDTQMIQL